VAGVESSMERNQGTKVPGNESSHGTFVPGNESSTLWNFRPRGRKFLGTKVPDTVNSNSGWLRVTSRSLSRVKCVYWTLVRHGYE